MLSSSFLDIAIGIVFVFLLLSLIASTLNEIIASVISLRGKKLLLGLQTLLNDTGANVNGLVARLYQHGQIFGLFEGDFDAKKPGNLPSYIPPKNFVMAMLDVVPEAANVLPPADPVPAALQAAELAAQQATNSAQQAAQAATNLAAQVPPPTPDQAAAAQVAAAKAAAAAKWACLRRDAMKLANNQATKKVGVPLLSMIDSAATDIDTLKTHIEDWYNSTMDRVSGWYKYHTQGMLLGIGIVLAIALNADTVNIVLQLSKNPTLRESVVAAAQAYQAKPSSQAKPDQAKPDQPKPDQAKPDQAKPEQAKPDQPKPEQPKPEQPKPDQAKPDQPKPEQPKPDQPKPDQPKPDQPKPEQAKPEQAKPDLATELKDVSGAINKVEGLGIPLGYPMSETQKPTRCLGWLLVFLGWLLTGIAVSLGAPFWFDILNKFMIVRSTVKPGEKSQPSKEK
jgi:hypothetical protein